MHERAILGLIEQVILVNDNIKTKYIARIDSGATSSSIDTNLAKELGLGPAYKEKIVKSASGIEKRPVIKVTVTILGQEIEGDFTLADRDHMTYPLLIGQNILKTGKFLIDPLKEVDK
jgi:hypothetical protein